MSNLEIPDKKIDVVLKAWDQVQSVVRSCEESASKTRSFALALWGALFAYAYNQSGAMVYFASGVTMIFCCAMEMRLRQIQYSFIHRSFEIERALEAYMVNDFETFVGVDVSTRISSPTIRRFLKMFVWRRWANWSPYLVALLITATAMLLNVHASGGIAKQ